MTTDTMKNAHAREAPAEPGGLLAIDLGLRMGLAHFDHDGQLLRYHAQRLANKAALKRHVYDVFIRHKPLAALITEGDASLAKIWHRLADKWGLRIIHIQADRWRDDLLLPRDASSGKAHAKAIAQHKALDVIAASQVASRPTRSQLVHDAAEAILIGLWGAHHLGWIEEERLDRLLSR